ncbi:MAG: hypothetical protein ACOX9E_07225, partial [Lentisphaeria bacterium]
SAPIGEKTGGVTRHRRTAAMRDMPPIICANLRNLRIKNVCYQWVTAYRPPSILSIVACGNNNYQRVSAYPDSRWSLSRRIVFPG